MNTINNGELVPTFLKYVVPGSCTDYSVRITKSLLKQYWLLTDYIEYRYRLHWVAKSKQIHTWLQFLVSDNQDMLKN